MSNMDPGTAAGNRLAVHFLRMWVEQGPESATAYIRGVLNNPDMPGVDSIITGQLNVGALLVGMLAEAVAEPDDDTRMKAIEILWRLAAHFAQ